MGTTQVLKVVITIVLVKAATKVSDPGKMKLIKKFIDPLTVRALHVVASLRAARNPRKRVTRIRLPPNSFENDLNLDPHS